MYDYICEVDKELKDNIGFDENENTNNNDFLYAYIGDDLETKSRIEKHIVEFQNKFNLIENVLDKKVESGEICDSGEFFEEFTKLSKIVKLNSEFDENLDNKIKNMKFMLAFCNNNHCLCSVGFDK